MFWNYRIVRHRESKGGIWYGLHEVYYDSKNRPDMWCEEAEVTAETPEEITRALAMMIRDSTNPDAPILEQASMPGVKQKEKK